jgi:hypothetical protein
MGGYLVFRHGDRDPGRTLLPGAEPLIKPAGIAGDALGS